MGNVGSAMSIMLLLAQCTVRSFPFSPTSRLTSASPGYLAHEQDRAVIIDIDLHHGNGTQSIVMNLNEASHNEELAVAAGKPLAPLTGEEQRNGGRRRRGWKGFYGSLHDIVSRVGEMFCCRVADVCVVELSLRGREIVVSAGPGLTVYRMGP